MAFSLPHTCYVRFEASSQEYAYDCGDLEPKKGDLVVVLVGAAGKPKIVTCSDVCEGIDPVVSKKIYGIVQLQPTTPSVSAL